VTTAFTQWWIKPVWPEKQFRRGLGVQQVNEGIPAKWKLAQNDS
jgi:hypothetical protein